MRLPSGFGRRLTWHLGLGPELGNIFWAMTGIEATFGAYGGIWPLWIEALGAPVTIVGLVLGSSGLFRLMMLLPSATLADRFDPRTLILIARGFTFVGLLSAGLATHWTQLVVMVIAGAVGEIVFPLTQAHLARHAGEQRVRAFTLVFNVGPAVAFGLAPLVAGALIAAFSMRAAFFFAALCTLFSIYFFTRISRRQDGDKPAKRDRSSYPEALAQPSVKPLIALQFATIFALSLGISLLPTFLADERGITPAVVAILGGIGSTGAVLFGLIVARSRWLQQHPLVGVSVGIAMVMSSLVVVLLTHSVWLIALSFIGRGGLWSAWGLYVAALSEVVHDDRVRPRVFTLSEMFGGAAFSTGPVVSGQLYAQRSDGPLLASLATSAALIPILLLVQTRLKHRPPLTQEDDAIEAAAALSDPGAV